MPFFIEKGDLVSKNVDCIVNASNVKLSMVEGVGRAIFHKAGDTVLSNACKKIGHCDVGDAVTTPPFGIENTKLLIHAVGPIYINSKHGEEANLRSAYRKSLNICLENNYRTIAFPLLSQEFNYPHRECYFIGVDEIMRFLREHPEMIVYMVIYKNFPEIIKEDKQAEIAKYIVDNTSMIIESNKSTKKFVPLLKNYLDDKGYTNEEFAYFANIAPSALEKILSGDIEEISKETILAMAIALRLSIDEANELLNTKGYVIDPSIVSDLVVCYYLKHGGATVIDVNNMLFMYGFKALGCEL